MSTLRRFLSARQLKSLSSISQPLSKRKSFFLLIGEVFGAHAFNSAWIICNDNTTLRPNECQFQNLGQISLEDRGVWKKWCFESNTTFFTNVALQEITYNEVANLCRRLSWCYSQKSFCGVGGFKIWRSCFKHQIAPLRRMFTIEYLFCFSWLVKEMHLQVLATGIQLVSTILTILGAENTDR